MNTWIYVQIDMLPLLTLVLMWSGAKRSRSLLSSDKRFQGLVTLLGAILVVDAINWYLLGNREITKVVTLNAWNALSYVLTELLSYVWFLYVFYQIHDYRLTKRQEFWVKIAVIPLIVEIVIIIASPWTHWVFYINEMKEWCRGSIYISQAVCGFAYMIAASVLAFIQSGKEELEEQKKQCRFLALVVLLPLIGGVLQLLTAKLLTLWPFTTASIFLMYSDFQSHQISVDALTGLNNRGTMERFLLQKVHRSQNGWYLVMMDVDRFKLINDKYGHQEGDRALQLVAHVLKSVFKKSKAFVSRYGGDEFVIITDSMNVDEVRKEIAHCQEYMNAMVKVHKLPFEIELSVGYAEYKNYGETPPPRLLEIADEKMYEMKNARKERGVLR